MSESTIMAIITAAAAVLILRVANVAVRWIRARGKTDRERALADLDRFIESMNNP